MSILFLDFDGVLHPDAVYLTRRGVELRAEGELFMWAPILEKLLAECPQIQVVLSTSWARNLGFREAKKRLPESVQARVIGATWHSGEAKGWPDQIKWDALSRYEQIARYCARARVNDWLIAAGQTISGIACCTATQILGWRGWTTTPPGRRCVSAARSDEAGLICRTNRYAGLCARSALRRQKPCRPATNLARCGHRENHASRL